jgi:signal transduction histidine kinase/ActR/RegA family two-component response regulator
LPAGLGGTIAIGYPPEAVFGRVDGIFRRNITLILVGAACALVAAWFFANLAIVAPVRLVVAAARRLAAGDLEVRTGVTDGRGELGELQQAFDEMASSLEAQQEHIRRNEERLRQMEKMDAIGRLAGGIAHDFNNLLTAIIGFGQLVEDELEDELPEAASRRRTYLKEIIRAGERAAELTGQLLIFSRKKVANTELVDLNALVQEMGNLLRRVIGEDVALATVLAPQLGPVRADPAQIEQIVLNLATNARDAMPTGGKLTIETGRVDLDPAFVRSHPGAQPGPHVQLVVSDTGMGMDRETQARIFEPFFTTKPMGQGTGLGLATVFGVVREAGGSVWVYSEPGRGTTFKVYLPLADEPVQTQAEAIVDLPAGVGTVLLVEDDEVVRVLARTVLEARGYRVLEAGDGDEAQRQYDGNPDGIDLLITDLVLPGRSGREIAEALQRSCPTMRVLYMSGYTDDTVVRHGLLQGEINYLEKPFTPAALARKAAAVLASPDEKA